MTLGCRPLVSHALPAKAPSAWAAASPRPAPAACSEPAWGAPATAPARGHGLLVLMPGPACKQGISTKKQNYEGWKRPPRSPYPTAPSPPPVSPTHPRPPQQHVRGFAARSGQKKLKKKASPGFSAALSVSPLGMQEEEEEEEQQPPGCPPQAHACTPGLRAPPQLPAASPRSSCALLEPECLHRPPRAARVINNS